RRNVFQLRAEVRHLLPARQQLNRAQNRQSSADQRQELLVEDQERLQLSLLGLAGRQQPARFHRVDVIAGLREPRPQLFLRGGRVGLLLHLATLVRQLDHVLIHKVLSILDASRGQTSPQLAVRSQATRSTPPFPPTG